MRYNRIHAHAPDLLVRKLVPACLVPALAEVKVCYTAVCIGDPKFISGWREVNGGYECVLQREDFARDAGGHIESAHGAIVGTGIDLEAV